MKGRRTILKTIAAWQVGGGVYGVTLTVLGTVRRPEASSATWVAAFIFALLYLGSIVAGVLLWRAHARGVAASCFVQALQIPQLTIDRLSFLLIGGVGPRFLFDVDLAVFDGTPIAQAWVLAPQLAATKLAIGLNLVAATALAYLLKARRHAVLPRRGQTFVERPPDTREIASALDSSFTLDEEARQAGPDLGA